MKKTFAFPLLLAVLAAVLSSCETVKGVGRDITGASSAVQDSFKRK